MERRSAPTSASFANPSLFHGALSFDHELRNELRLAIEQTSATRRQVAATMADLSASHVTEAMLDSWTAPSRGKWSLPVKLAVAFDVATGGTRLLDLLARKHGRKVLTTVEALDAELGAIARQEAQLLQRRAEILSAIAESRR